jgi:hypothetical protein
MTSQTEIVPFAPVMKSQEAHFWKKRSARFLTLTSHPHIPLAFRTATCAC